jgi:hypothetical protein
MTTNKFQENDLENFALSSKQLRNSNILTQLTWALYCAIKKDYLPEVTKIVAVVKEIETIDKKTLMAMMSDKGDGEIKYQNMAYVWFSQLYTSAFSQKHFPAIIAMTIFLNSLLTESDEMFAQLLTQQIEMGSETGRSPLLMTSLALLQLISVPAPYHAKDVSGLLEKMAQYDNGVLEALPQKIINGAFREKSILFFLIKAMSQAASDMPEIVLDLCKILTLVIAHHPESLKESLFEPMKTGDIEGLTSIQMILASLVSTAYGKKNQHALNEIILILEQLLDTFPDEMLSVFTQEIPKGEHATKNGIFMLTQAYTAAKMHALETSSITRLLGKVADEAPQNELKQAYTHQPTMRYSKNKFPSSLDKMGEQLKKQHPDYDPMLLSIVNQIRNGSSAILAKNSSNPLPAPSYPHLFF